MRDASFARTAEDAEAKATSKWCSLRVVRVARRTDTACVGTANASDVLCSAVIFLQHVSLQSDCLKRIAGSVLLTISFS